MGPAPRTVLIVDDDASLRSSLASVLDTLGYRILTTGDPEVAYRLLASEPTDAVLLDVRLPTMSGLALYLGIAHRWPRLKGGIALMTADAEAADVRAWTKRNPCSLIRKPFSLREITTWLDAATRATDRTASAG